MSIVNTIKAGMKAAGNYLAERFTREKLSSWGGLVLTIAGTAGYLSGPQASLINLALTANDIHLQSANPDAVSLVTGLIFTLLPTSKLAQRLKGAK